MTITYIVHVHTNRLFTSNVHTKKKKKIEERMESNNIIYRKLNLTAKYLLPGANVLVRVQYKFITFFKWNCSLALSFAIFHSIQFIFYILNLLHIMTIWFLLPQYFECIGYYGSCHIIKSIINWNFIRYLNSIYFMECCCVACRLYSPHCYVNDNKYVE